MRLSIEAPGTFTIDVDNTVSKTVYAGMNEIDVTKYLTQAHNGQPTPGVHTIKVHTL